MAALNFPSSPNVNDTYTANGKSWKWDGVSWVSSNFLLADPKITLGGTYGTSGQVMTSQGNGVPPAWGSTITALKEVKSVIGASDIDLSAGNYFTKTISANTTFTVSNAPASGTSASFILELTDGGSKTVAWFSGVKWPSGTAPTLTASGVDILGFYSHDGGATWRGLVLAKDSK